VPGVVAPSAPAAVRAAEDDAPAAEPAPVPHPEAPAPPPPAPEATVRVVPIDLDTVLRLAEGQNAQVALARERVHEAYASKDIAAAAWLPDVFVGMGFYRHEGGIQNEDGTLTHSSMGALFTGLEMNAALNLRKIAFDQVNAERNVWQQKGELSRITSETLLEATETYIDLLATYEGREIARAAQKDIEDLLERARKLEKVESSESIKMEVARLQGELYARQQTVRQLREQARSASAKLVYLLGLDPCVELVPIDARLVRLELVDTTPPTCQLVDLALTNGPGVREMEGLLAVIHDAMERSKGASQFLPILEVRMAEGGFGAGPGDRLDWDNRWDLGIQARWNVTEFLTGNDRRRAAESKIQQAHLAYQDLRAKLTAGVQAAREQIASGNEQFALLDKQIKEATYVHQVSYKRRINNIEGSTYSEVLLALQGKSMTELSRLNALRAYDKAQVRLMILLGPSAHSGPPPVRQLPPAAPCQLPTGDRDGQ
jgi:outer membrane protein TolC